MGSKRLGGKFLVLAIALVTLSLALGLGNISFALERGATTDPPLTPPRVHPLPPSLRQDFGQGQQRLTPSEDGNTSDFSGTVDYFSEVKPTPLGYLIWSQFPVKIYLDRPDESLSFAEKERFESWVLAIEQSIQEWRVYLPLEVVASSEEADIRFLRSFPSQQATRNPTTGMLELPRAAAAQTRYQFYLQTPSRILSHRFTIHLSPNQTPEYTLATARHELGHALGIWGHSLWETDVMYFSQVRTPPAISLRDFNTLKKIYQQPTQLGWRVEQNPEPDIL